MHTQDLEDRLARLRAGDDSAREELVALCEERIRVLARKMFRSRFSRLRRWEQTDDVFQRVILRLHKALAKVQPETKAQFYGLAAKHIKWVLKELARKHDGLQADAAHHHTDGTNSDPAYARSPDPRTEPKSSEEWEHIYEAIEQLPKAQQSVVNLMYFDGLTQVETAEVLGIAERTVRRHWVSARLILKDLLSGEGNE